MRRDNKTYGAERLVEAHQEDDVGGGADEEYLHNCVVQADKVHEQVHVPHQEHYQVDLLSFAGQA